MDDSYGYVATNVQQLLLLSSLLATGDHSPFQDVRESPVTRKLFYFQRSNVSVFKLPFANTILSSSLSSFISLFSFCVDLSETHPPGYHLSVCHYSATALAPDFEIRGLNNCGTLQPASPGGDTVFQSVQGKGGKGMPCYLVYSIFSGCGCTREQWRTHQMGCNKASCWYETSYVQRSGSCGPCSGNVLRVPRSPKASTPRARARATNGRSRNRSWSQRFANGSWNPFHLIDRQNNAWRDFHDEEGTLQWVPNQGSNRGNNQTRHQNSQQAAIQTFSQQQYGNPYPAQSANPWYIQNPYSSQGWYWG